MMILLQLNWTRHKEMRQYAMIRFSRKAKRLYQHLGVHIFSCKCQYSIGAHILTNDRQIQIKQITSITRPTVIIGFINTISLWPLKNVVSFC